MKIPLVLAAAVLAATVAYGSVDWTAPSRQISGVWPVMVDFDPERGIVMLSRADFDAIVRAYNDNLQELRSLRFGRECTK